MREAELLHAPKTGLFASSGTSIPENSMKRKSLGSGVRRHAQFREAACVARPPLRASQLKGSTFITTDKLRYRTLALLIRKICRVVSLFEQGRCKSMTSAYQSKKINVTRLTGRIFVPLGALFLIIGVAMAGWALLSLQGTVSTQGSIVSCSYADGTCRPLVRFQASNGQNTTFRSSISSSSYVPEGSVTVWYHPNDPLNAQTDPWILAGPLSLTFGGIGLLFLLVGGGLLLWRGDVPSARVVNQFYAAMQNQEYTVAFQYLNPGMKTGQGEPITPEWFIQRARAYDAERGTVTRYTLTGFHLKGATRDFALRITRAGQSYKNHLRVQKLRNEWTIVGFDVF